MSIGDFNKTWETAFTFPKKTMRFKRPTKLLIGENKTA